MGNILDMANNSSAGNVAELEPSSGAFDLTKNLTYQVLLLANSLSRSAARQVPAETGMSVPEWRVIAVIASRGEISFNALAETLDIDKGWVSRTLAQLEASGHVVRSPDPQDGRQLRVSLTKAGRALHTKGARVSRARQRHLASHFSEAELDSLYHLLGRLRRAADELL